MLDNLGFDGPSFGTVDFADPVDSSYSLNADRLAWWLTLPNRFGGSTWWDLVAGNPAAFSGFTAGHGWSTASNPGGAGSVGFNGSPMYALCSSLPSGATLSALTLAFWGYRKNSGVNIVAGWNGGTAASRFLIEAIGSDSLYFFVGGNGYQTTAQYTQTGWHHYAMSFVNSTLSCYLDGQKLTALTLNGTIPANYTTPANFYIGYSSVGAFYTTGNINDVGLWWKRALSASEILSLYSLSKQGYPGILRRRRRVSHFVPSSGSGLSLGTQSAAWTNPGLSEAFTLPLAAESAAWTNPGLTLESLLALPAESAAWNDPALSLESLLTLAAETAAWNDPALSPSLSSSLALGEESATWTNPALALALALAVGQQSATWTNPALTTPTPSSALTLLALSATWTNPGLAVASYLALAAESASWTNPLLNEAVALALTGQSTAWSNPALTPTNSQGLVIQLPAESALWNVAPLGLFFCPTVLNPYFGLEWLVVIPGLPALARESCVISNTEQVTLYRKTADGVFDGGTLVGQALRLDVGKELTGKLLSRNELQWYLWASQTGTPAIKDGDVIQDANGVRWTIWRTHVQAWGSRFFVETKQER